MGQPDCLGKKDIACVDDHYNDQDNGLKTKVANYHQNTPGIMVNAQP